MTIAITADPGQEESAAALASRLQLPYGIAADWYLHRGLQALELRPGDGRFGAVRVDFLTGRAADRSRGVGRSDPLARALAVPARGPWRVLDVTGGLGRDAWLLASLGCDVIVVERHPVVAALLADGLLRAAADPVAAHIQLRVGDAREVAADLHCDAIYLDPMFPERTKSALVKKEMQAFQALVGDDDDAATLLCWARQQARSRIAVKRPRLAPTLFGVPSHALVGKTVRFDVYLPLTICDTARTINT